MISIALDQAAHALGHRHPEEGELLGPVAEPHAEQESPAGDDVQEGADLGHLDRVVERQQDQVRPDLEPLGLRREALEERQEREVVEPRGGVVLAAPDRVEPERADEAHLLHRLGESARGIVPGGVLGVHVDAEAHPPLPSGAPRAIPRPRGRVPGPRVHSGPWTRSRASTPRSAPGSRAGSPAGRPSLRRPGGRRSPRGEDTLIAAPTGSGKTLAAFLVGIDRLFRAAEADPAGDLLTEVVYVSPLKALAADIRENLDRPLAEIREVAQRSA